MRLNTFRMMTSAFGLAGTVAFAPAPAFAQDKAGASNNDSEIVVTAQRREEASVDVPITVNTLGSEQLKSANVTELADIAKVTPAVRFDFAGAFFQPTIRGVGTAVASAGAIGNVGIYVDGFYLPNPLAADFQLMKLRNIQVLKGPQGTLFGRNTTGGAILVQTADPSTKTAGEAKVSYGRYNDARAQAYATFGLSDKIAMDVEGLYSRGDGWQRNISNNKRVGDYENWSARVGLKAELSDSVSVLLRYQHGHTDDPSPLLIASYTESVPSSSLLPFTIATGAPFAGPGQFTFNRNEIASGSTPSEQEYLRSNTNVIQGTIKADLGFADLTSYTQYRKEDIDSSISLSYSAVPPQLGLPNDNATFSQELLLTSKPGSKLQWTTGLFYFQNRDTYLVYFDYLPSFGITSRCCEFGSSATSKSLAAFLDVTYEVSPKLFITAGARYSHDWDSNVYSTPAFGVRTDATQANYDSVKQNHVTPRFVIRYKPTDQSSIYASYTKGYKGAMLDLGAGVPILVQPETIDAYEAGFKYDTHMLSFEAAGFYYNYKNLQVSLYENALAHIRNAASSEIYGLDGQMRYTVSDHFQVNLGAAWVHARYKDFPNAPIYVPCYSNGSCASGTAFPVIGQALTNVTMQRTPEFTGNIGARYKTEVSGGNLQLSGNLSYSSKLFFGPSGIQFPQKAYEVLSLRAQWTDPSDRYSIAVYGDNVTNSRYLTQVQYGNSGIGANWSKPVTYGVELGVKF